MLKLYRFRWDFYRMGEVVSTFVADDAAVAEAIGRQVYFGEILGKHSEVYGELEENSLGVLTDDQEFIAKFEKLGCASGYNPLDYIDDEEEEEDD